MFTTSQGVGSAPPTAGVGAGAPPTAGVGSGFDIKTLLSKLGGQGGSIADLLSSIFGGNQQQGGFKDLESQIQGGIGQQKQSLAQALGLLQPFQQGGSQAFQQELGLLGGDPTQNVQNILSQFQQSPAQKASIQAGLGAVQNRLGSQGLGGSGAEQKELEQFAQQQTAGQQQQFLQNVLGEKQQQLGGLSGLSGLGFGAAQTGAGSAMQAGTNISDLLESLGLSQSAQAQSQAKQTGGIFGSLASILKEFI